MKGVIGGVLLCAALSVGLAGCGGGSGAQPDASSPTPSSSPSGEIGIPPGETGSPSYPSRRQKPMKITLTRTGGFAGVSHRIEIQPDGAWKYAEKGGKTRTGELTDQQVSKLQSLAMDERLPAEAKHKDTRRCADGFSYALEAGTLSMTAVDCGGFEERPAFTELVKFVKSATPM